jgi:endonuclease YncB( thermonuclease family)
MDLLQRLASQGYDISGLPTDTPEVSTPSGIQVLDGDTVALPTGERVRMLGINTEETAKFNKDKVSSGYAGADEQTKILHNAIKVGGFNRPVLSGDKDRYDRNVGDLVDESGRSLTQHMLNNGYAMPNKYTTPEQMSGAAWSSLERTQRKIAGEETGEDALSRMLLQSQFPEGSLRAKQATINAKQFGASLDNAGHSEYFSGPMYITEGEDRTGYARSNLKTGLSSGYDTMKQGVFDALDSLGTVTGSEFLQSFKTTGDALQTDITDLPFLRDAEAFDENGDWTIDSFSKAGNYLVGTAASSAPQFLVSIAAGLAAPMTMGASLAAPAIIYAGNTWRNQAPENKSAAWAWTSGITQSAIESLGVTGVFTNIFEKKVQEAVVGKLMAQGMTKQVAEKAIIDSTRTAIKQVTDAVKAVRGGALKQIGVASIKGLLNEAPEEALQELTQYFGEQAAFRLPETPEDMAKLKNRLANAAVGGAVLGTTLGGAHEALRNIPRATPVESQDRTFREKLLAESKLVPEATAVIKDSEGTNKSTQSLAELAGIHESALAMKGIPSRIATWWSDKGPASLWKANSATIMGVHNYVSKPLAALGTLLGANRVFSGGSIDEQRSHIQLQLASKIGSLAELRKEFGDIKQEEVTSIFNDPSAKAYIEKLIQARRSSLSPSVLDNSDLVNANEVLSPKMQVHKEALLKYADRMDQFVTAFNEKTGYTYTIDDILSKKPVDKTLVARNKEKFTDILRKKFKLDNQQALDITNRILDNDAVMDVTDALDDILNFDSSYSQLKSDFEARLNDPENVAAFSEFLSHDIFRNMESTAVKGASAYVNKNLIGADGSKLNALLQAAIEAGDITQSEAAFKAKEIKDWMDMRTGKYHPVTNPYVQGALGLVNFLTTVTSLPLAAVSSTVEFAQVYRNLNLPQSIKATKALLEGFGGEFGHVVKVMGGRADTSKYRETLNKAGYLHEGNISQRTDVVSGYFQKWTEGFFKMTGLTSITNVTRYAKLAIGSDAIMAWLTQYKADPTSERGKSAYENLLRIGVNVELLANPQADTEEYKQAVMNEFTKGTNNFVLEAVVQPSKMNRPKFYNDPYLQLFTQFQGYTSTFTANILPRLVRDIQRTGTSEQANAAAVIAMMMALSFFALYMKDMIKYGESPPEWLRDEKKFQRFIGQTGLTGTGQRLWDAVDPVLPDKSNKSNVALSAARAVSDQAPALSFLGKVNDALSAQEGSQIKKTARLLPVFGTSPNFATYLQKELGGQ